MKISLSNSTMKVSKIEDIKRNISIVEVFERYLPGIELKRRGHKLWVCCPFHGERTPSFMLDPRKNRWRCFGCGEGGSQIDLAAKATGKTFPEAINMLAAELGIQDNPGPETSRQRQEAIELSAAADRFILQVATAWTAAARLNREAARIIRAVRTDQDLLQPLVEWALERQALLEGTLDLLESDKPAEQWRGLQWYRRILRDE